MNKKELMKLMVADYRIFFQSKDVDEYKSKMTTFLKENEGLSSDEFFEKMHKDFPAIKTIDQAISRIYLSRIASNTSTIKTIVLIYFILSIVVGLIIGLQLTM